jgi:ATP phosphoribosyltransferase regulatory subunit HisZ
MIDRHEILKAAEIMPEDLAWAKATILDANRLAKAMDDADVIDLALFAEAFEQLPETAVPRAQRIAALVAKQTIANREKEHEVAKKAILATERAVKALPEIASRKVVTRDDRGRLSQITEFYADHVLVKTVVRDSAGRLESVTQERIC